MGYSPWSLSLSQGTFTFTFFPLGSPGEQDRPWHVGVRAPLFNSTLNADGREQGEDTGIFNIYCPPGT